MVFLSLIIPVAFHLLSVLIKTNESFTANRRLQLRHSTKTVARKRHKVKILRTFFLPSAPSLHSLSFNIVGADGGEGNETERGRANITYSLFILFV